MSTVTQVEEILLAVARALAGAPEITGRVVDQVGLPVEGALVRVIPRVAMPGAELARGVTGVDGTFAVEPVGTLSATYEVVVTADGVERRIEETRRPPFALGDVAIVLPLRLNGAVGDGDATENFARDVRRVQDRLHRLGRLSAADLAAEAVAPAAPPALPGPRTMAALAEQLAVSFGRRLPVTRVEADGPTLAALRDPSPFPVVPVALARPVGLLPGMAPAVAAVNDAASIATVQRRLNQLGVLSRAAWAAEANPALAMNEAARPATLAAIRGFDATVAAGSLKAIVPGRPNARLLGDPFTYGRPLRLSGSVGQGGDNRREDVLRVQDGLLAREYLSADEHRAEQAVVTALAAGSRVGDDAIPHTIAGLGRLAGHWLGGAEAARALVHPVDATVRRLDHPEPVELEFPLIVGPLRIANPPGDVRKVQDRLRAIGLLSAADYEAEKADPRAAAGVVLDDKPHTTLALARASLARGPLALGGGVGEGQPNAPADVRLLQDRMYALGLLTTAEYERDQVDPAGPAPEAGRLASLFSAIARVRRQLLGMPEAVAGQPWTAHPVVHPGDPTHRMLEDAVYWGRRPLRLAGPVGREGWNFPADVRAVQERLREMGLVTGAEAAGEPLVDPGAAARVGDAALAATLAGIRRLRTLLLGEAEPVPERVEAVSTAVQVLENRFAALRAPFALEAAVGWGGANRPADVLRVQRRLRELGFLPDAAFEAESRARAGEGGGIADADIPETLEAIAGWRAVMLAAADEPRVEPHSETLWSLGWPRITRRIQLATTRRVGAPDPHNPENLYPEVRRVQDRLFELGMMDPPVYFRDRVNPALAGQVPAAAMATTRAAIRRLQETLAGMPHAAPDEAVDPGGRAARVLEDPGFLTPTIPNPVCDLTWAGPTRLGAGGDANLDRTFRAIEAAEGGLARGEIPAIVRNASWTPTSWGSAQVIGRTALGSLNLAIGAPLAAFYGLDEPTRQRLGRLVEAIDELIERAEGAVPGMLTEEALLAAIADDLRDHGAGYPATGLLPDDIPRVFRAWQLRHQIVRADDLGLDAARLFNPAPEPGEPLLQPHAVRNLEALRLAVSDVRMYFAEIRKFGENWQGFVTRALLLSPEGQVFRNLLTDDTGFKIGRFVIRTNWNSTNGLGLTAEQRARVTAYMHNHGGNVNNLAAQIPNGASSVNTDAYTNGVMATWVALP